MELRCDLEVDVHGEEVYLVNKGILSSFCSRLSKLFNKPPATATTGVDKVILHGLPGGPEAFELVARFCYSHGKMRITPSNACLLHHAAHFMEMTEDVAASPSLIKQTEKSIVGISYWSWFEILNALKQCENLSHVGDSNLGILDKLVDSLAARIASSMNASPSNSSPESSGFRFSCDTRSTTSTRITGHRAWWFEHLAVYSIDVIDKTTKAMLSRKVSHTIISRFLFYYLKNKFSNATSTEKVKLMEVVVNLLYSLDKSSLSCKGLFGILHLSSCLNLPQGCRARLESMIGFQLDEATLDNLLVPSPPGVSNLYDVNLVLRFLKSFLASSGGRMPVGRLKRVGSLMDLYLAEVAPDPCLKPRKFVALAMALPDAARDSYDGVYRAIVLYLEVHAAMSEKEKMRICYTMNSEKLSSESCKHLARSPKCSSRKAVQALVSQHFKPRSLLQDTAKSCPSAARRELNVGEQVILYARKLELTPENENLKAHLQGMQRRVIDLEKLCQKMQSQLAKILKSRIPTPGAARAPPLPRLCS